MGSYEDMFSDEGHTLPPSIFTLAILHNFGLVSARSTKCPLKNGEGWQPHSVTVQEDSLTSGTHTTLLPFSSTLYLSFDKSPSTPLYCLIQINKGRQWVFFSFLAVLFNDREVFQITIKYF